MPTAGRARALEKGSVHITLKGKVYGDPYTAPAVLVLGDGTGSAKWLENLVNSEIQITPP